MKHHNIKTNRACRLAGSIMQPASGAAIMSSITPDLIDRLTARELASVMHCLNAHWQRAIKWQERQIVGDGYVWDDNTQKPRDLALESLG